MSSSCRVVTSPFEWKELKRPARPVEAATDRSAPDYAYCLQCKKHKAKASQRPASRQTKDKMFLVTNPYGVQVSLHRTRAGAKARLAQFRLCITDANARALCSVERIAVED